ncbi:hypothetical protein JEQ12_002411, partial [Ovis aries]
ETERIYCELGGEAAASQIEGPGTCLVAKLRGAEGSGSLPWTSRVPLPQASCLLTPGPSDLTRDGTRKQRGPEEQKWVLGGTPLRRFDFVPARGLALLQVASLLGNDPEGQGRVAAFSSAAAPAPRLFLPEWPQQSDGHRGGIPERGVSVPGGIHKQFQILVQTPMFVEDGGDQRVRERSEEGPRVHQRPSCKPYLHSDLGEPQRGGCGKVLVWN